SATTIIPATMSTVTADSPNVMTPPTTAAIAPTITSTSKQPHPTTQRDSDRMVSPIVSPPRSRPNRPSRKSTSPILYRTTGIRPRADLVRPGVRAADNLVVVRHLDSLLQGGRNRAVFVV